jgi:hypothetical protein
LLVGSVEPGDGAIRRITYDGMVVGYAPGQRAMRYWSPGYSISLEEIEALIREEAHACLKLMLEVTPSVEEGNRRER